MMTIVQERSVRLQIVLDSLIRFLLLLFQPLCGKSPTSTTSVRLPPAEHYLAAILRFNILADVRFQDFVGDAELVVAAEHAAICD